MERFSWKYLIIIHFIQILNAKLRQVVILSRHGVRGPYGPDNENLTMENIKKYTKTNFPFLIYASEWGTNIDNNDIQIVEPMLTKHGAAIIEKMGKYIRHYVYPNLFEENSKKDCSDMFAYADNNQRDNLTAEAFFKGFAPECQNFLPEDRGSKPLFQQGQNPTDDCPVCSKTVYSSLVGGETTNILVKQIKEKIIKINDILGCCHNDVCQMDNPFYSNHSATCSLFDIKSQWNGLFFSPWKDTLSAADYFSEFFLLQSLNNMTLPRGLTFDDVIYLAGIHKTHIDLTTNLYNSMNFGSTLLTHITASLDQTVRQEKFPFTSQDNKMKQNLQLFKSTKIWNKNIKNIKTSMMAAGDDDPPHIFSSISNRFLYYAGHDINLLYLRNLLRMKWMPKNWLPNQPCPGAMIILELHSDKNKNYLKAFFLNATPKQMRNAEDLSDLNPPDHVVVGIPGCSIPVEFYDNVSGERITELRCDFEKFKFVVGKSLKKKCVAENLRNYAHSLESLNDNYTIENDDIPNNNNNESSSTNITEPITSSKYKSSKEIRRVYMGLGFILFFLLFGSFVWKNHYYKRQNQYEKIRNINYIS